MTEETEGESVEAVSEPRSSVDVKDPELACRASPSLSERGEQDDFVAAEKEMESKETEQKETEAESASPENEPSSQSSFFTEVSTVLVQGGESDSTSASEQEVKTEEDSELYEENVAAKDNSSEESPAGPDISEDSNTDKTSEHKEATNTDEKTSTDIDAQQEKSSLLRVSTADDLDEMMDIGTVDQVEQEALMKEEEVNCLMDVESSRSPAFSNTGKVKVFFLCYFWLRVFALMMQRNIFKGESLLLIEVFRQLWS